MQVKELFTDDNAVSPVIGVILMVAITVILAAVIGAFVLNIGGSQEAAPQASFDWDNSGTNLVVTHQSGGAIDTNNVKINVGTNTLSSGFDAPTTATDDTTWEAGEEVDTGYSGTDAEIVWMSPSSDKTSIIGEYSA